jgi:hypothetical protein
MTAASDKDDDDAYSIRYVAFVDILGFSEIVVRNAEPDRAKQRKALVKLLHQVGDRGIDQIFGDDFLFQQFSDSIIMSESPSGLGLVNLLGAVSDLAEELLSKGLLIRGGIAKGTLHHDDKVVFGPAFLDAYRIESTIAEFPRVVLSSEVYKDALGFIKKEDRFGRLKSLIKLADDGPAFVHVLADLLNEKPLRKNWHSIGPMISRLLRDAMHDPRRYKKLKWLAVYWNETVRGTSYAQIPLRSDDWLHNV